MGKMTDGAGIQYIWAQMEQYLKSKLATVPQILPFPLLRVTNNVKAQTAHIDTYSNYTGYPDGIVVRYKKGSEPTESDTVVDISAGITVSSNDRYYFKAFAPDGSGWQDSPSNSITVSIPALKTLPTPSISVSRLSSSQGRVTISNYSSYPSGTKIVINGTSYSMTSSVTLSIGTSATTVTAYATYNGSEYYESTSSSTSKTIPEYEAPKCATPSINQNGNTVSITCSTSGATIYYRKGTSGSYTRYTGSFSISSSVTVYAYATASGYSTSNTASRYCSYTAPTPSLPAPSIRVNSCNYEDGYGYRLRADITNGLSFPSGTTFNVTVEWEFTWNGQGSSKSYSVSRGSSNTISISTTLNTGSSSAIRGTVKVTACCSGYKSSTGSASFSG